jgi:hypothetical protein
MLGTYIYAENIHKNAAKDGLAAGALATQRELAAIAVPLVAPALPQHTGQGEG